MYNKFFQMTIYRRIMRKNVKYENMLQQIVDKDVYFKLENLLILL